MANTITQTRDLQGQAGPGGIASVVESDVHISHGVLDTLSTSEISICVLNLRRWKEAVMLINVSALSATNPQLIFNVWQLDQKANRYPLPGSAPANNGFVSQAVTAANRTRNTIQGFSSAQGPMGGTIEITVNTGTSNGAFSATFDIEVQLKSA